MALLHSSRLPGVTTLQIQCTGPEYSRWRRSLKFALESKGMWKYCNGKCPMPMPKKSSSPTKSLNAQPTLLDERRDWVKHDREAKLDIFLSLTEEVMLDVFEVGPPLPPTNLNAQKLLEALDERFEEFDFEAYHHTFCHFLNLHIDQYASLEEFNTEFTLTLEDLLDHGHPLSNVQKCSAYFSKLRCTQNPWVAEKLEQWNAQTGEIQFSDLLKESPSWSIVRPLVPTTVPNHLHEDSLPELDDTSASDSDSPSDSSETSAASSASSPQINSDETANTGLVPVRPQPTKRFESYATVRSLDVVIVASAEDVPEIHNHLVSPGSEKFPEAAVQQQDDPQVTVPSSLVGPESQLPEWLARKKSVARRPVPEKINVEKGTAEKITVEKGTAEKVTLEKVSPDIVTSDKASPDKVNRPLPPIPTKSFDAREDMRRSRSSSPHVAKAPSKGHSKESSLSSLKDSKAGTSPPTYPMKLERAPTKVHSKKPSLSNLKERMKLEAVSRPESPKPPTDVHPALRAARTSFSNLTSKRSESPKAPKRPEPPASNPSKRGSTSTKPSPPQPSRPFSSEKPILLPARRFAPPIQPTQSSPDLPPTAQVIATQLRRPSLTSPATSSPNLVIPWPSSPDLPPRPHSSRASQTFAAMHAPLTPPEPRALSTEDIPKSVFSANTSLRNSIRTSVRTSSDVSASSGTSLPMQGTRDSAWAYLYEAKGGYLVKGSQAKLTTLAPTNGAKPVTIRGKPAAVTSSKPSALTQSLNGGALNVVQHKKSGSLDFMTRLSGDSEGSGREGARAGMEKEKQRQRKKSWLFSKDGKGGKEKEKEVVQQWI